MRLFIENFAGKNECVSAQRSGFEKETVIVLEKGFAEHAAVLEGREESLQPPQSLARRQLKQVTICKYEYDRISHLPQKPKSQFARLSENI